jgi:hypothetical protein
VINILAFRSTEQRLEVRLMYKTMYGRDLLTTIDDNSSRNTQRVLQAMCRERDERDAHVIMKVHRCSSSAQALIHRHFPADARYC